MIAALLAAAALTVPAGFSESAVIDARASVTAGKSVHVYCAATADTWNAYVETSGVTLIDVNGLTVPGGDEIYLSPDTCSPLLWKTRKHAADLLHLLGAALDVMTHETMHARGITDEGVAECDAIHAVPSVIPRWGYKRGTAEYRQVLAGARNFHSRLGSQYHTVC